MDKFARLNADERRDYFEAASSMLSDMSADIIQKDFWVCWTLKHLFDLGDIGDHGMAESFVKTFKRDYAYVNDLTDALVVEAKLAQWFEDYNEEAPHKGLKMMSPRQFRRAQFANG
jgi:hypothetical protein